MMSSSQTHAGDKFAQWFGLCRTLRFTFSYAAADAQRHRKMIEKDDSSFQAKKIHVANLQV